MKIEVTAKAFDCPAGSLVRLSHEPVGGDWKSLFDRCKPWLEKHGAWMRTTRKLQFKQGLVLEIQGPIKDRLLASQFTVLEADEAEVPAPSVAPKKKVTKKKVTKK